MIDTLAEFKDLKNIDKDTMISVLEDSFRNVIAKMFGTDENFDVIINPEKGDFEIWRNRTVVAVLNKRQRLDGVGRFPDYLDGGIAGKVLFQPPHGRRVRHRQSGCGSWLLLGDGERNPGPLLRLAVNGHAVALAKGTLQSPV